MTALPATVRVIERDWLSANHIVFHDDTTHGTVVDTGYVAHQDTTWALIHHALDGRQLVRVINTHLHSDHCGGNALLRERTGCSIFIPPGHADAVARWDEGTLSYRETGQRCPRFAIDGVLAPDDEVTLGGHRWRAVAGPGHDPHQLMLWCAALRVLISADVLWQDGFGAIFPEVDGESGFAEQRAMLERIAELSPALVIPGHGAPFADVTAALSAAHSRLAALAGDPRRNARSIGRTLIKFHLLEVRRTSVHQLVAHFASTRLARRIHEGYFPEQSLEQTLESFIDDLVRGGAARRSGDQILDAGES